MGNCNSCDCETDLFRGIDAARLCGSYIETEGEKCGRDNKYSN